jgi:DNA repair ATPase RecN
MEERVKIQYSVTLSELKTEVERLLNSASIILSTINDNFVNNEEVFSIGTLDNINCARESMMKADVRLDEVGKLISGYISYITNEQGQQNNTAPPPDFDPDDIENLKQKLNMFRSNLQQVEVNDEGSDRLS